jgi:GntR family transcriptional regulator
MNFNPTIPIYLQIMDSIKKDILSGTLVAGERLDSVRSLAAKFGVNLNTMQRACSELEREGILTTQRGIGSFVTEDHAVIAALQKEMTDQKIGKIIKELRAVGYSNEEIVNLVKKALEK